MSTDIITSSIPYTTGTFARCTTVSQLFGMVWQHATYSPWARGDYPPGKQCQVTELDTLYVYVYVYVFSLADLGGGRRHVGSTGKVACGSPRRAPPHTYQEQPLQGRSYHAHIQATLVCMGIDDACFIAAIFLVAQSL